MTVPWKRTLTWPKSSRSARSMRGARAIFWSSCRRSRLSAGTPPRPLLPVVTQHLGATPSEIYGVLTFYNRFHLSPRGKHTIRACRGTACHFKGSLEILEKMREHLKMGPKQDTTDNTLFSIEEVACLGACGIAPVITVDEEVFGKLEPENAVEIISRVKKKRKGMGKQARRELGRAWQRR